LSDTVTAEGIFFRKMHFLYFSENDNAIWD